MARTFPIDGQADEKRPVVAGARSAARNSGQIVPAARDAAKLCQTNLGIPTINEWTWHFRYTTILVAGTAIAAGVCQLLDFPGVARGVCITSVVLTLVGLLAAAISLPWPMTPEIDPRVQALKERHMAHWTYDEETWRAFAESELVGPNCSCWKLLAWLLGGGLALGTLWAVSLWIHGKPDAVWYLVGSVFAGGALGALLVDFACMSALLLYRQRLVAPRKVYFGEREFFATGHYVQWSRSGYRLVSVDWVHGEHGVLAVIVDRPGGKQRIAHDFRILIPLNKTKVARSVLKRWKRQIQDA
ncbi:MAG TPA: hypothetical protein VE988_05200 [Gemmataceae bacterium]|nr:hypothetical protein [Gemmataceae bacterium]